MWLAFLFHALYAEVGGNPNFSNISESINMVIRTTFDLVSFTELVNDNAGFGYGYDVWLPNSRCVVCGAAWWLHRWFPTANCVIAQGKLLQHASEPVRLVLGFHLGM